MTQNDYWDFTDPAQRAAFDAECQDPDNCPDHPWRKPSDNTRPPR